MYMFLSEVHLIQLKYRGARFGVHNSKKRIVRGVGEERSLECGSPPPLDGRETTVDHLSQADGRKQKRQQCREGRQHHQTTPALSFVIYTDGSAAEGTRGRWLCSLQSRQVTSTSQRWYRRSRSEDAT